MGIEGGGKKLRIELSVAAKKAIEGEFSGGRKLTGDSFNADLERIKYTRDTTTVQQYLERAAALIYSKK